MCGNLGFITHREAPMDDLSCMKRQQIIRGLGIEMELRGQDSSGIVGFSGDSYELYKRTVPFTTFLKDSQYKKIMSKPLTKLIGHTRQRSSGSISDRNAHPFEKGDIIGAHNGWVTNWITLGQEKYKNHEVDSEIIFDLLNEYGNDYTKVFSQLEGAVACVWYDKKQPDRIFLVSHTTPLSVVYANSLKTYFYASTHIALENILTIVEGTSYSPFDLQQDQVYEITDLMKVTKNKVSFKEYQYSGSRTNYDPYDDEDIQGVEDPEFWQSCSWRNPATCNIHGDAYRRDHPIAGMLADTTKVKDLIGTDGKKNGSVEGEQSVSRVDTSTESDRLIFYMQLPLKDICDLYNQLQNYGCGGCANPLDVGTDGGFWYHKNLRSVFCDNCLEGLQDSDALMFFTKDEYAQIMSDVLTMLGNGEVRMNERTYDLSV